MSLRQWLPQAGAEIRFLQLRREASLGCLLT
jgi:hypothetical protein